MRKSLAIAACLALGLGLSACTDEPSPDEPTYTTPSSPAPVPSGSPSSTPLPDEPVPSDFGPTDVGTYSPLLGATTTNVGLVAMGDESLTPKFGSFPVGNSSVKLQNELTPILVKYFTAYFNLNGVGNETTGKYADPNSTSDVKRTADDFRFLLDPIGASISVVAKPQGSEKAKTFVSLVVLPPDLKDPRELYNFQVDWKRVDGSWLITTLSPLPPLDS